MREVILGGSGIRVSEMCLGTMTFGTAWGWGAEEATCRDIYASYRDAGGNFVDTADIYTDGESEAIVGRLIAGHRDSVVVATKFTLPTDKDDANSGGSSRKSLRRSVETSLRRLGTDYLDVLWVHAWDDQTPVEETHRALDDLVRAGKVLAIGISNAPAWVISRANAVAEQRDRTPFCAIQVGYSLAERSVERELLPMAAALGLTATAWSPLGRGLLAGKRPTGRETSPREQRAVAVTADVAGEVGTSPARVALAWLLRRNVIPVLGARTRAQIDDNLAAAHLTLSEAHLECLDRATDITLGYPHEFLRARVRQRNR